MAIIDKNCVFVDGAVRESAYSNIVALTSLRLVGRMDAMPLRVSVTQGYDADELESLTLTLQQIDTNTAPHSNAIWADVHGATLTLPGTAVTTPTRLPWRFLPEGVEQSWLRFNIILVPKAEQTISTGRLFIALMREEDLPYVPAQQVK